MLQRPMDRQGRPYETDATEGRFIITTDQFLDAAVWRILPLGGIEYQYPMVVAKKLHLWEPSFGLQFFSAIGASKIF